MKTVTFPVGLNLTSADSHKPTPQPKDITAAEGAIPHASMYVENPIPLNFPFASDFAFLSAKPL